MSYKYYIKRTELPLNDKGETFVNIYFMPGYHMPNLPTMIKMANVLHKELPFVNKREVEFDYVNKSRFCQNFMKVTWCGYLPKDFAFPKGWYETYVDRIDW